MAFPEIFGVSRMYDNDRAILLSFQTKPTDDELRSLHEFIAGCPGWFSYDRRTDTITMFGIRYSAEMFKAFGVRPVGWTFQIIARGDGIITISETRNALEAASPEMLTLLKAMVAKYQAPETSADIAEFDDLITAAEALIATVEAA